MLSVFRTVLTDPDEPLHRRPALFAVTDIAFAYRLADQFGDGRLFPSSTGVERSPQLVVQVQLCTSHNVYRTSQRPRALWW